MALLIAGRTPAVDINLVYDCVSDSDDWHNIPPPTDKSYHQSVSPLTLNATIPDIHLCNLVTRTPWYFKVKGIVTYEDFFKRPHSTTFCLAVAMRVAVIQGHGKLGPCREFHPEIT